MRDGQPCGSLIPGLKSEKAFASLISAQLKKCHQKNLLPFVSHESKASNYILEQEVSIPTSSRYFFKPLADEGFIYHDGARGYIKLLAQKRTILVPGTMDHFPSPDLELFAIPTPLRFFDLQSIVRADLEDMQRVAPLLEDVSIDEDYESIGMIRSDQNEKFYRIMTSSHVTSVVKDYRLDLKTRTLSAASTKKTICGDLKYSVPMISKSGELFGIQSNDTEFSAVMRIGMNGDECTEILNLGRPTGKIAFDYKDENILFVTAQGEKLVVNMVNLESNSWTEILSCSDCRYTFPDFTPSGRIMVMQTVKTNNEKTILILKKK
jgi:hypothetical protein